MNELKVKQKTLEEGKEAAEKALEVQKKDFENATQAYNAEILALKAQIKLMQKKESDLNTSVNDLLSNIQGIATIIKEG